MRISANQDGGSGNNHDYFLFSARINSMASTTAQDKKKAYSSQGNTIWTFLPDSGRIGRRCLGSSEGSADDDYGTALICLGAQHKPDIRPTATGAALSRGIFPPCFCTYDLIWRKRIVNPDRKSYSAPGLAIRVSIRIKSGLTCPYEWRNLGIIRIAAPVLKWGVCVPIWMTKSGYYPDRGARVKMGCMCEEWQWMNHHVPPHPTIMQLHHFVCLFVCSYVCLFAMEINIAAWAG